MATTEEKVVRAATELFALKGFAATGIRELAERSGVSTAALYHYMGTKEDLLVRLMITGSARILSAGEKALASARSPAEELAALVHVQVLAHALHPLETTLLDHEIRSLTSEQRGPVIALRDEYEALWMSMLSRGREAQVFNVDDTKLAKLALLEMCAGVTSWFRPDGELDAGSIADKFLDFALGMLRARHGRRPLRVQQVKTPDTKWLIELLK